jgi:hypothetical protein
MILDFYFGRFFHNILHSAESESKLAANHKIVLTRETSRRILLLAEKKR